MTELEKRKHIKPLLNFIINELTSLDDLSDWMGMCTYISDYVSTTDVVFSDGLEFYLKERLAAARPKDSGEYSLWWSHLKHAGCNRFHINKRVSFCKLQLKIVKP